MYLDDNNIMSILCFWQLSCDVSWEYIASFEVVKSQSCHARTPQREREREKKNVIALKASLKCASSEANFIL